MFCSVLCMFREAILIVLWPCLRSFLNFMTACRKKKVCPRHDWVSKKIYQFCQDNITRFISMGKKRIKKRKRKKKKKAALGQGGWTEQVRSHETRCAVTQWVDTLDPTLYRTCCTIHGQPTFIQVKGYLLTITSPPPHHNHQRIGYRIDLHRSCIFFQRPSSFIWAYSLTHFWALFTVCCCSSPIISATATYTFTHTHTHLHAHPSDSFMNNYLMQVIIRWPLPKCAFHATTLMFIAKKSWVLVPWFLFPLSLLLRPQKQKQIQNKQKIQPFMALIMSGTKNYTKCTNDGQWDQDQKKNLRLWCAPQPPLTFPFFALFFFLWVMAWIG